MRTLLRLLGLWRDVCRYRLDELLPKHTPLLIKLLLWPAIFCGKSQHTRAERLRNFLEAQGPIFVKFGQLMSTRPDMLPDDIARELQCLQDRVAPFDSTLFQSIVERDLGAPIATLFGSFDTTPMASASIAQVHAATLKDGGDVVIKVLRPNIEKRVKYDLRVMDRLAKIVNSLGPDGRRLHAPEVVDEYRYTIEGELDLRHEAANAQKLRDNFIDNPVNYTPKVYWDFVRPNIMVSERIYGIPVNDRAAVLAQGTDLKLLAEIGVGIFFTQVFEHNFFHADMHPGNIFISRENVESPQYISVDCAIIGSLTETERTSLAAMLLAVFRRDYLRVAEVQIQHGWVAPDTPVHRFEAEIRAVCEPIFAKPLSEISFADMLVSLFKTARRFDMQVMPSLVLLEKTIINIEGLGRQLYPELDLWATAQPYLERWSKQRYAPKTLIRQLRENLPDYASDIAALPPLLKRQLEQNQTPVPPPKPQRSIHWLGLGLLAFGLGLIFVSEQMIVMEPTTAGLILAATGSYLLLRKP